MACKRSGVRIPVASPGISPGPRSWNRWLTTISDHSCDYHSSGGGQQVVEPGEGLDERFVGRAVGVDLRCGGNVRMSRIIGAYRGGTRSFLSGEAVVCRERAVGGVLPGAK
jgi:hypothetical protein